MPAKREFPWSGTSESYTRRATVVAIAECHPAAMLLGSRVFLGLVLAGHGSRASGSTCGGAGLYLARGISA